MAMFGVKCAADETKSTNRKTACTIGINMSFLKADDVDIVSLCYVPDNGTLGCREILHLELKDAQGQADGYKVLGPGFLSGVCNSTGILLILLMNSVSRWHH